MGLDINAVRFLTACARDGISFGRTLTIGRQGLFVEPEALDAILARLGVSGVTGQSLLRSREGFAEPLLEVLGAQEIQALDYSPYQDAAIVHDMNLPIADRLKEQFSVVLDSGSLEHIFNFPQAIKNCMEMVAVNGHFVCITVANNLFGHGFYQFSPELFFRVLHPDNGFRLTRMIAYEEDWSGTAYYEVVDPEVVRRRVTLVNRLPTFLMMCAQRVSNVAVFSSPPQQSDYATIWKATEPGGRPAAAGALPRTAGTSHPAAAAVRRTIAAAAPRALKDHYRRRRRGPRAFDPAFFHETSL